MSDTITIEWVAAAASPTPSPSATSTPAASQLPNAALGGEPSRGGDGLLTAILAGLALGSAGAIGYRTVVTRRPR